MTLFTKIIQGQIPSYKIYEDDLTMAFLDIKPHQLGHTLVVPKIEVGSFQDLPAEYLDRVFVNAQKIAKAIEKATNCKRVGLMVQGFGIPEHFHLHVCPMFSPYDLDQNHAYNESEANLSQIAAEIIKYLD